MPSKEDNEGTKRGQRARGSNTHGNPNEFVDQLLGEYRGPEEPDAGVPHVRICEGPGGAIPRGYPSYAPIVLRRVGG